MNATPFATFRDDDAKLGALFAQSADVFSSNVFTVADNEGESVHEGALFHEEALNALTAHLDDPFDETLLSSLAGALTGKEHPYRAKNAHILALGRFYVAASPTSIPLELTRLFQRYAHLNHPHEEDFDDVFRFAFDLLHLHPLRNGNGRLMVCMVAYLLHRFGLTHALSLPLDALHNGAFRVESFTILMRDGGVYYGQRPIDYDPYIAHWHKLLSRAYSLAYDALAKGWKPRLRK